VFAFPRHDQAMMNDFKDLMESGLLRPVIDRSYRFVPQVERLASSSACSTAASRRAAR
jgi:hypothetical protein